MISYKTIPARARLVADGEVLDALAHTHHLAVALATLVWVALPV